MRLIRVIMGSVGMAIMLGALLAFVVGAVFERFIRPHSDFHIAGISFEGFIAICSVLLLVPSYRYINKSDVF